MYLHHVSEVNPFTDAAKQARKLADDTMDTLFKQMFANAKTMTCVVNILMHALSTMGWVVNVPPLELDFQLSE